MIFFKMEVFSTCLFVCLFVRLPRNHLVTNCYIQVMELVPYVYGSLPAKSLKDQLFDSIL